RRAPMMRRWDRADAGTAAVYDLALLPGGRVLVALGELGVRLHGRDGRVVAAWDQPAHALVVADAGTRAIAVAPRGGVTRLARLDLAARTARSWCEAAVDAWAPTYDGRLWLVARGGQLLAIDALDDGWRASWGVTVDDGPDDGLGLTASALARDDDRWVAAVGDLGSVELWRYEGFTLRERAPVPSLRSRLAGGRHLVTGFAGNADAGTWLRAGMELAGGDGDGDAVRVGYFLETPEVAEVVTLDAWRPLLGDAWSGVLGPTSHVVRAVASGRFAALAWRAGGWGMVVEAWYLPARRRIAVLAFEGADAAAIRLADLCLLAGDDRGRAVVVDLRGGAIRRDLRAAP
ncbi:MAG: hypothetical protein H6709_24585, partial [Kofleriaceae bacterium]|nr:hypothetical protein [Kofleriaceae bacterium]